MHTSPLTKTKLKGCTRKDLVKFIVSLVYQRRAVRARRPSLDPAQVSAASHCYSRTHRGTQGRDPRLQGLSTTLVSC